MVEAFVYLCITTSFGVCRPAHVIRRVLRGGIVPEYTMHLVAPSASAVWSSERRAPLCKHGEAGVDGWWSV